MHSTEKMLHIPYGMRDYLPAEATQKRIIENILADTFSSWGYEEIVTPTIEYLDTLLIGNGEGLEPFMFKLFDKNNRTLALRHEMTTSIARVVASRLKDEALPLRLSYISSVFRYEQTQTGRQCEFYQAGVELMGASTPIADAEIVALAIEGLRKVGLADFQVCLGQVDFVNGIMEELNLSTQEEQRIKESLEKRNLVSLENIVEELSISEEKKSLLKSIPLLHGGNEIIEKAQKAVKNKKSIEALDNLLAIYEILKVYGVENHVQFDLDVIRDFNYYTGMVFEVYTPGLGFPICGGGRYNNMLDGFGYDCPATGFASGIERIMLALERQGRGRTGIERDLYIAYAQGQLENAILRAKQERSEKRKVTVAPTAESEETARETYRVHGYKELVYIK